METGFNAYIFYIRTKVFYNQKSYDITKNKINKNRYINKWNTTRANKDGLYFQTIENYLPRNRNKFIRLFSYHYLKNSDFYVKEIIDEDFNTFKFQEYQLFHIKECIKTDFRFILNFADKNNREFKDVFIGKKIPPIFKMYDLKRISIYSLIVFNEIFHLLKKVNFNNLNFLDKERYIFYNEKIFNKFKFVIGNYLFDKKYNWIEILKKI